MAVLDSAKVCEFLNIKPNNLHQLNYRKKLVPVKKEGKINLYDSEDVLAFKEKRDGKNS